MWLTLLLLLMAALGDCNLLIPGIMNEEVELSPKTVSILPDILF